MVMPQVGLSLPGEAAAPVVTEASFPGNAPAVAGIWRVTKLPLAAAAEQPAFLFLSFLGTSVAALTHIGPSC